MKRKDSILANFYYQALPKAKEGGNYFNKYKVPQNTTPVKRVDPILKFYGGGDYKDLPGVTIYSNSSKKKKEILPSVKTSNKESSFESFVPSVSSDFFRNKKTITPEQQFNAYSNFANNNAGYDISAPVTKTTVPSAYSEQQFRDMPLINTGRKALNSQAQAAALMQLMKMSDGIANNHDAYINMLEQTDPEKAALLRFMNTNAFKQQQFFNGGFLMPAKQGGILAYPNNNNQSGYVAPRMDAGGFNTTTQTTIPNFGLGPMLINNPIMNGVRNAVGNAIGYFMGGDDNKTQTTTPKQAEQISAYNQMNTLYDNAYSNFMQSHPNMNNVPYSGKTIKLTKGRLTGADIDTGLLDYIKKIGAANKIDPYRLAALVSRESTFGVGTGANRAGSSQALVSGWNVDQDYVPYELNRFLADKKVPGINSRVDGRGWHFWLDDENKVNDYLKAHPNLLAQYQKKLASIKPLDKNASYFDLASQWINKPGGIRKYNPGAPGYESLYNQDLKLLQSDPAFSKYFGSKELGGDISIADLRKPSWLTKYNGGGPTDKVKPVYIRLPDGRKVKSDTGESSMYGKYIKKFGYTEQGHYEKDGTPVWYAPGYLDEDKPLDLKIKEEVKPMEAVTVSENPLITGARRKAKGQIGTWEDWGKTHQTSNLVQNSGMANPIQDLSDQQQAYRDKLNKTTYQNIIDQYPIKEGEERLAYINRLNTLLPGFVEKAKGYGLTEPFDPENSAVMKQWVKKGYNHLGALAQATANPTIAGYAINQGIAQGNVPVSGLSAEEAQNVGVTQPFETLDNLAYKYAIKPGVIALDNLGSTPSMIKGRDRNMRYVGPTDSEKLMISLLNPLNYLGPGELISGGRNLFRGAEGVKNIVNASKETGLLSNTYKINPWRFKPSRSAFYNTEHTVADNIANQYGKLLGKTEGEQLSFYKGAPKDQGGKYMVEHFPVKDEMQQVPFSGQSYADDLKVRPKFGEEDWKYNVLANVGNDNTTLYKKDWLMGWKNVNPNKTMGFKNIQKSILPDFSGIKSYPKELYLASKDAGKLTLPKYKDIYRLEPTTFAKDADQLSGRWFTDQPSELSFYVGNKEKNPMIGSRILKQRVPERIWRQNFGENMPLAAKRKSIGFGKFGTAENLLSSKTLSPDATATLMYGTDAGPGVWKELSQNPLIYNQTEGIMPDLSTFKLRGLPSNKLFSPYTRIEGTNEMMSDIINNLIQQHWKSKKFGIKKEYLPFEKGGSTGWLTKYQTGGGLLSRTVTCSSCGWSWKAVDGGKDVMTCHHCGGMIKMQNGGSMTPRFDDGGQPCNIGFVRNAQGVCVPINQPTRADSIALLNNTNALLKYYNEDKYKPYYDPSKNKMRTPIKNPVYFNDAEFKQEVKDFNSRLNNGLVYVPGKNSAETAVPGKNVPSDVFYKPVDKNKYYRREYQNRILDTRAPMQLIDKRIKPHSTMNLWNYNRDDMMYDDGVLINLYEPLATTPWDMLKPKQQQERLKKYGVTGTPYADPEYKQQITQKQESKLKPKPFVPATKIPMGQPSTGMQIQQRTFPKLDIPNVSMSGPYMVGYQDWETGQGVDRGFATAEERDAFYKQLGERNANANVNLNSDISSYYDVNKRNMKEYGGEQWLRKYGPGVSTIDSPAPTPQTGSNSTSGPTFSNQAGQNNNNNQTNTDWMIGALGLATTIGGYGLFGNKKKKMIQPQQSSNQQQLNVDGNGKPIMPNQEGIAWNYNPNIEAQEIQSPTAAPSYGPNSGVSAANPANGMAMYGGLLNKKRRGGDVSIYGRRNYKADTPSFFNFGGATNNRMNINNWLNKYKS